MIYLILILTITNTAFIFYFHKKQTRVNKQIVEALFEDTKKKEEISVKNKQYIDDMLKMREMYESD